jgi:hypothetical protein
MKKISSTAAENRVLCLSIRLFRVPGVKELCLLLVNTLEYLYSVVNSITGDIVLDRG